LRISTLPGSPAGGALFRESQSTRHRVCASVRAKFKKLPLLQQLLQDAASRITTVSLECTSPLNLEGKLLASAEPMMDVPCSGCIICAWCITIGQCTTLVACRANLLSKVQSSKVRSSHAIAQPAIPISSLSFLGAPRCAHEADAFHALKRKLALAPAESSDTI
jgi:hypothetical protein